MPGTPPTTTPDLLPRIGDADSPDIPRDMNALADATQAALIKQREAKIWFYLSEMSPAYVVDVFRPAQWTGSGSGNPALPVPVWDANGVTIPTTGLYLILYRFTFTTATTQAIVARINARHNGVDKESVGFAIPPVPYTYTEASTFFYLTAGDKFSMSAALNVSMTIYRHSISIGGPF